MVKEQLIQVLSILVQAAEVGQKAGAYDLQSASVIAQAAKLASDEIAESQKDAPMEVSKDESAKEPVKN